MKNLLFILLIVFASCSTLKKVKTANQEQTKTETTTETEQAIKERVDTVLIVPARYDSVLASLRDLFAGVEIGPSKARYDTVKGTLYLNTPIKYIPYYINRDIRTTIREKAKTETESKSKVTDKEVTRSIWGWIFGAACIIVVIGLYLKNK